MKTYEPADLLAVIDTDIHGYTRTIPFSYGAFLLHHNGIWLWFDETQRLTNDEKKKLLTGLGLPDVTIAATSIDEKIVWGIGRDKPLMSMPFTLAQLDEFDKASRGAITESIKPNDDEDFATEKIGINASEVARFLLFREMPLEQAEPVKALATPAPVATARRREKKPSIETVALDYMRTEFKQGQFQSAAKFHKHLVNTAEKEKSPFEMGKGPNARKLFCPAASSFFDAGTLGKIWPKIRAV